MSRSLSRPNQTTFHILLLQGTVYNNESDGLHFVVYCSMHMPEQFQTLSAYTSIKRVFEHKAFSPNSKQYVSVVAVF